MKSILSASIMCADLLNMRRDLAFLEAKEIGYFHCDVMDGHFVPNLMLPPDLLRAVKRQFNVPLDVHLMVEQPEKVIPWLAVGEGDVVSVHYESTPHICRALDMIREKGATPALALNPGTPLECAQEILDSIGMLLVMTVNPGFAAQKMVPNALAKIARAREMLDAAGLKDLPLEVDGNCSLENIPRMEAAGANIFVVGSSSVFSAQQGIEAGLEATMRCLKNG